MKMYNWIVVPFSLALKMMCLQAEGRAHPDITEFEADEHGDANLTFPVVDATSELLCKDVMSSNLSSTLNRYHTRKCLEWSIDDCFKGRLKCQRFAKNGEFLCRLANVKLSDHGQYTWTTATNEGERHSQIWQFRVRDAKTSQVKEEPTEPTKPTERDRTGMYVALSLFAVTILCGFYQVVVRNHMFKQAKPSEQN